VLFVIGGCIALFIALQEHLLHLGVAIGTILRIGNALLIWISFEQIVAVIGIYGSLSGKKGEFWAITEKVGNSALILLIIIVILYFAAKDDIRYDPHLLVIYLDKD